MTVERVPAAPVDQPAAALMWSQCVAAQPDAVRLGPNYTVEHFGDSAALADQLLRAVIRGQKRATSEPAAEFPAAGESIPRLGSHWIACDGAGVLPMAPASQPVHDFWSGAAYWTRQ